MHSPSYISVAFRVLWHLVMFINMLIIPQVIQSFLTEKESQDDIAIWFYYLLARFWHSYYVWSVGIQLLISLFIMSLLSDI